MVINTALKKWCRVTSIHPAVASIGESSTWTNEKFVSSRLPDYTRAASFR